MTLKTRLFGKRIKGEPLKKLVKAMGENPEIFYTSSEKFLVEKVRGKCTLVPVKNGINVDLYIFKTDVHFVDGSISSDKYAKERGETETRVMDKFHLEGKIPYSAIKQGDK